MYRDETVRHAYAHLVAAVEKLRAELEAQALARCRLAEEYKSEEDGEDRRAFDSYQDVDQEALEHVRLAREALRVVYGEGPASSDHRGPHWDDLSPEEVLEEARRRRIAQDRAFALMTTRLEDLTRLDDFDPDGFRRGGTGGTEEG